jgi:NAD(P)-dependent dehydrogenase (short-subunit alcohol dehydrogenase family)
MDLDLGSLASVRAFAQEIAARDLPLRALVCNAGLQRRARRPHCRRDGGITARTGLAQAETYNRHRKILFIGWHQTDTTREQK